MSNKKLEVEQRLNQLEDVEAIKKLKYTYAVSLDEGYDGDKVAELFISDGLWSISGVGGTARGRDGIRQHTNNLGKDIIWGQHNILAPIAV